MSLTVLCSPNSKTGTTTVANYLGVSVSKKTKQLTLLIEFSRYTGRTIYMQRQCTEKRKSLKNVVMNPKDFTVLKENIMISKNSSNLYFLAMNIYEDFLEMKSYASTSLTRIIENAKNYFKHIIIDLPSNMEEPVVGAAFSNNFGHRIDNILMVIDEDVLTAKMLSDYSSVLRLGNADIKEVTYVMNKVTNHYVDFIDNHLELPLIKPLNIVKLLWLPDMVDCCNRGTPDRIGVGRNAKAFRKGIDELTRIVLSPETISGVGLHTSKRCKGELQSKNNEQVSSKQKRKKEKSKKQSKEQDNTQIQTENSELNFESINSFEQRAINQNGILCNLQQPTQEQIKDFDSSNLDFEDISVVVNDNSNDFIQQPTVSNSISEETPKKIFSSDESAKSDISQLNNELIESIDELDEDDSDDTLDEIDGFTDFNGNSENISYDIDTEFESFNSSENMSVMDQTIGLPKTDINFDDDLG